MVQQAVIKVDVAMEFQEGLYHISKGVRVSGDSLKLKTQILRVCPIEREHDSGAQGFTLISQKRKCKKP